MLKLKILLLLILLPQQFSFSLGFIVLSPFRLFLILLLPWLLLNIGNRNFRWCGADIFAVLISIWPLLTLFVTSDLVSAFESGGIYFLEIFVPYFLVRKSITSYEHLYSFSKYLLVVIAILALSAIPELFTGKYFINDFFNAVLGKNNYIAPQTRFGFWRAVSVTSHPIVFGSICSIGFILSLSLIMRRKKYLYSLLLSFIGVLSSLSSGPLLSMMSQLSLFLWARVFARVKNKWVLLLFLIILAYFVVDVLSNRTPLKVMFSYLLFSPHNGYVRYEMWVNSIFLVNQSFFSAVFGYGLKDIPFELIDNYFFSSLMRRSVDSFWLVNLLRYGWVIFAFWACLIFSSLRKNRYYYRKIHSGRHKKIFSESWFILVISITLISTTVDFWGGMKSIFIILIACLCTNLSSAKRNNARN